MNLTLVSIHFHLFLNINGKRNVFFKSNTFHRIDNVEQCVIYRENRMGILDLRGIQPRERKHFLDKRDHPGSFLLNIQQMFIVPAYFRR